MGKFLIIVFLFSVLYFNLYGQENIVLKTPSKADKTQSSILFTSMTQRSPECVFISGRSQFDNNFFVDSCIGGFDLIETRSLGYVYDISFTSQTSGWAIIDQSIVKINNKKITQAGISEIDNTGFNTIYFEDSSRGWALGDGGRVAQTIDGGKTWKFRTLTDFDLTKILSFGQSNLWVMGYKFHFSLYEEVLLNSKNGGETWEIIRKPADQSFRSIRFFDKEHGVALTAKGRIEATGDGGTTWTPNNKDEAVKFLSFFFLNETNGWAVDGKNVYFSSNAGSSWRWIAQLPDVLPYEFSKLIFLDNINGWIFSKRLIMQTNDGGMTWKSVKISDRLAQDFIK